MLSRNLFLKKWCSLLLILSMICVLQGCKKELKTGFSIQTHSGIPVLSMTAIDDFYFIDNVSVDLFIGTFQADTPSPFSVYENQEFPFHCFAIYICGKNEQYTIVLPTELKDYKNVDNHHLIKEISSDECFLDQYGYHVSYFGNIKYEESEKICIPKECFENTDGTLFIKLVPISKNDENFIVVNSIACLEVDYEIINENQVKFIL